MQQPSNVPTPSPPNFTPPINRISPVTALVMGYLLICAVATGLAIFNCDYRCGSNFNGCITDCREQAALKFLLPWAQKVD